MDLQEHHITFALQKQQEHFDSPNEEEFRSKTALDVDKVEKINLKFSGKVNNFIPYSDENEEPEAYGGD